MPEAIVLNKEGHPRTPDFEEIDHTRINETRNQLPLLSKSGFCFPIVTLPPVSLAKGGKSRSGQDFNPNADTFRVIECLTSAGLDFAQHDSTITTSASDHVDMATNSIKLLTGNSHPSLAKAVAQR